MNAADSVGSQWKVDVAGATRTSCQPIQGRHATTVLATPVMILIMENAALNAV